jgi:phage terminase large subunit GpA-like protein
MMDVLNDPQVQTIVVIKSAQVGYTEILLNILGYYISQDPSPVLLVNPTLEMAEVFSKTRLAPMLRDTPILSGLVADARARDSGNTLLSKAYPGGTLAMAGANSPAGLASRPIRIVLCDEVDRFPVSAGAEGDPVNLAIKRSATFSNRKIVLGSTPTIKGESRIEAAYQDSDQRRYCVPCPECGEMQHLVWANIHWETDRPDTAVYHCDKCGAAIDEKHKPRMLARGKWIAERPCTGVAGFHVNELYSPWRRWSDVVRDYLASRKSPETHKTWVNTSLGETWDNFEESRIDFDELKERAGGYEPRTIPPGCLLLTAGIDVQKDRFALIVLGHGRGGVCWVIDYVELPADPTRPGDWAILDDALKNPFQDAHDHTYRITAAAIDAGYLTDDVLQFTRQHRGLVIAIKGASTSGKPIIGKPSKVDFTWRGSVIKGGAELWIVGHDTSKAQLFARLAGDRKQLPQDRLVNFPSGLDDAFYAQLTAEIWDGTKRRWIKIRPRNEALDCYTYATAAAMQPSLRIHTWREAHWLKWEARAGAAPVVAPAPVIVAAPTPPARTPAAQTPPARQSAPVRRQSVTRRISL